MISNIMDNISGKKIFLIGIKGTGMTALAQWLHRSGALVSGSDVAEVFYTDDILKAEGIGWIAGFKAHILPEDTDFIVYSSAYESGNAQLEEAQKRSLACYSYPEMLGLISQKQFSVAIAGIHGKTSTTALCGVLTKVLEQPASVIVGSSVPAFGNSAILHQGDEVLFAETCEYKRNFLSFFPSVILVTSIEEDHLDYFRDYKDILAAFCEFCRKLPEGGFLVYCGDDSGSCELADLMKDERPDIHMIPYGFESNGPFGIEKYHVSSGEQVFKIAGMDRSYSLKVPGRHMVLNAAGSLAVHETVRKYMNTGDTAPEETYARGLVSFSGTRRRSEIIGEAEGILVLDDYGHHPTAIRKTLEGYRDFYPGRRLVVDFMSHTYSRTEALLYDFASAFSAADHVILHKIYASAREQASKTVNGLVLYDEMKKKHSSVVYYHEVDDAYSHIKSKLVAGDIFITMGAGNNWPLGRKLLQSLQNKETL